MRGKFNLKKITLTKELTTILLLKITLLFVLWWWFFNPQTKVFVDEHKMANILVNEPSANQAIDK